MALIHASDIDKLVAGYQAIKRLKAAGYGDSRVTSLTTVASLIADILTFRNSAAVNAARQPIFDTAIDYIKWAESVDLLNTTLVTALTTVATDGTAATTDLSYNFWGATGFPTTAVPRTTNDLTISMPVYAP